MMPVSYWHCPDSHDLIPFFRPLGSRLACQLSPSLRQSHPILQTHHRLRMDDSLPDLVRDWELETRFASDKQTIHTIYVSDPARGRWRKANEEVWDQTTRLGKGAFGVVYLQKCVSGPSSGNLRAVKEIQVTLNESSDKFLSREISAIVKFSHKRVRSTISCSLS